MDESADLATLLRQSQWMRQLARRLVRDDAAADDLVQETWVQALRHRPRAGETVRPWLGEVLRNVFRARLRSDGRRTRREDAAVDTGARVASPEELVGAVELQRELAGEVLRLDEPYRTTVLRVFFDGLTPTEIATRDGLPAGTVRWRLKQGLDQLRHRLDRKHAGDREAWKRALAPLLGEKLRRVAGAAHATHTKPALKGASLMKIGTAVVCVAAVGAVLVSRPFLHSSRAQPATATAAAWRDPAAARVPTRMDGATRADFLRRLEAARRAAGLASTAAPELDTQYVATQMREIVPLVEECFDNATAQHPGLQGTIVVAFSIIGTPSVGGLIGGSQIVDAKTTIADKDVRECIQETMYALQFPPPPQGGEVRIEYPFVLRAADEPKDTLSPAARQRLDSVLASGKLPDGAPLSDEQRRHLERVRDGKETLGKVVPR